MGLIALVGWLACLQVFGVAMWFFVFRWLLKEQKRNQRRATDEYFRKLNEVLYGVFKK